MDNNDNKNLGAFRNAIAGTILDIPENYWTISESFPRGSSHAVREIIPDYNAILQYVSEGI